MRSELASRRAGAPCRMGLDPLSAYPGGSCAAMLTIAKALEKRTSGPPGDPDSATGEATAQPERASIGRWAVGRGCSKGGRLHASSQDWLPLRVPREGVRCRTRWISACRNKLALKEAGGGRRSVLSLSSSGADSVYRASGSAGEYSVCPDRPGWCVESNDGRQLAVGAPGPRCFDASSP
jgi:hypothetical protein